MDSSPSPLPERPGERDCAFFLRTGSCRFGPNCRFNHPVGFDRHMDSMHVSPYYGFHSSELPERIGQPECQFYLKTGTCKFGSQCKYHHPNSKSGRGVPQLNYWGLPLRPGEKECVYYLRTGLCKFGVSCKFHHPEPAGIGTVYPSLSPLYSNGALVAPVPLSSWSMLRPAYLATSGFPTPSPYLHVYTSSPQNIPITGWNVYQNPGNHVAADGQQMDFVNVAQQNTGWKSTSEDPINFPQRPGQPDCHFYMKTGLCKFGSNCKYHHPKDNVVCSMSASLNPMGLPLRPGMPLCTFYLKNGICKFGPVCKFDHPIESLSEQSISLFPCKEPSKANDSPSKEDLMEEHASLPMENGRYELVGSQEEPYHKNNNDNNSNHYHQSSATEHLE